LPECALRPGRALETPDSLVINVLAEKGKVGIGITTGFEVTGLLTGDLFRMFGTRLVLALNDLNILGCN
jgi:hypothetical protein